MQVFQHLNILPYRLLRKAQQPLNVRADIIHPGRLCVQHHEHIVHIQRELCKQLLPVEKLSIFPAQLDMAFLQDQQDGQQRKADHKDRYDQHSSGLQRIHAGVYDVSRDKAHQHPILHIDAYIGQVIVHTVKRHPR